MVINRRSIFLLLFFVSGACGLIYEIVWTRLFIPIIGNTAFSVSAILTTFMAGLAVGSRVAGRRLDSRPIELIRTYAFLEAGVGIYNLLLPLLLRLVDPLFGTLYHFAYGSFLFLAFARLVIAFCLLIVPAGLMGATLPVLIRFYAENISQAGSSAGRVYAWNTCGAAIGAAGAGLLLVPLVGAKITLMVAAVLNLAIAVCAGLAAHSHDSVPALPSQAAPAEPGPIAVLAAMFLSGLAALVNEVTWTRVLGLVVGPTTYAFTLMLTSMIAGLGTGAALGAYWTKRRRTSLATLAWIELGIGTSTMALIPAFGRLPVWIGRLVTRYMASFTAIQAAEFFIFFSLLLVPTTLLGITFPIACRLYAKCNSLLGTEVSAVYAFNTVGGILGSLIAAFVLIPRTGLQTTLVLSSCIGLATAVVLAVHDREATVIYRTALTGFSVGILALSVILIPRWDTELMVSGAYKYAPYYPSSWDLETALKSGKLVYFKAGATSTVSIRKFRGDTMLSIDGKVDASDTGDMTTQKMLAHLPLLLANQTKQVAIIGLGSGVTAGAALQHPIESLDVVEISPEVAAASKYFLHVNHHPLEDSRTHLIIGDGRNHLRYTGKKYDVTISEPSNPWMSGMASLFTREFFQEVLARLTPNGIHCQWLHSYNMSTESLRTIIRTFRSVFSHAQLWALNENDFLLLGSHSRIAIDEDALRSKFHRVGDDLKAAYITDVYTLLTMYMLEDDDLDTFAAGAPFNTDDRPTLEFSAPRYIYADTSDENYQALKAVTRRIATPSFINKVVSEATSENFRHKAEMYAASESYGPAVNEFETAITKDVENEAAWQGLVSSARGRVDRKSLENFFEKTVTAHPSARSRLAASDFFIAQLNYEKAEPLLNAVLQTDPKNIAALERLADVYAHEGNAQLPNVIDRLRAIDPENPKALYHLATLLFYQQRFDEAIQVGEGILQHEPKNIRVRNLLAFAYAQTFQPDKAEAEFHKAIELTPIEDFLTLNNYGRFLIERGRFPDAIHIFTDAIDANPENVQGYVGIADAYRESGNTTKALEWYRLALRLDPNQPVAKQYVKQ